MLLLLALACAPDRADDTAEGAPAAPDWEGIALRQDGWLRGDLHVHTDYQGGFDDLATNVALAEYLGDEAFLAAHPEFEGNHLDYLAITDHRMVDAQSDPDYHSDRLVLVGGEESGSGSHAGTHGIHEFIDHDPDDDGLSIGDLQAAIDKTHSLGGTFSPNHPMLPDISWPWDTRDQDGIEVWNSGWALMAPENTLENVEAWEARYGVAASPMYRRAVQERGNASAQTLRWYEALLTRRLHLALIGGSDRHAVLLPAFPTTYVRAATVDEAGVIGGIEARHTFVARGPAAAQVLVTVQVDGIDYQMGDAVPAGDATVTVRVGRADGGVVRLVGGSGVDSDEAVASAPLGQVLVEETVEGDDFVLETTMAAAPGDWFYPVVIEPLLRPGTDDGRAGEVRALAEAVAVTGEEDFLGLATLAADYVDPDVLFDASNCDPAEWNPELLQCLPVDDEGLGSFFVPDDLDRAFNVIVEDGVPTDWTMGAVGSAVRFEEPL